MRLSFSSSQATILFSFYLSLLTLQWFSPQWFSNPNLRLNSQPCITQKTCSQCSVSMQSSASMKYSSILPIFTLFFVNCCPFWGFLHYIEKGHLHQINQLSTIKDAHLLSKILPNGKAQKLILSKNSLERVRFDRHMQMKAKLW